MSDKNTLLEPPFSSIQEERKKRIIARYIDNKNDLNEFKIFIKSFFDNKTQNLAYECLEKISKLSFPNINVNLYSYHAHLVRVAMLTLKLNPNFSTESVVPSLIHNIIETTNLDEDSLSKIFSKDDIQIVKILTVDRSQQHLEKYLQTYYNKILNEKVWLQTIKLVDKMDNMFTLCLNSSEIKRKEYLKHINRYIVPLAKKCSPQTVNYLEELINNCKLTGYNKFNLD